MSSPVLPHFLQASSGRVSPSLSDPLVSSRSRAGRTPWPGFKRTGANKARTGLTLNYPHEWRANPIFISPWLWNAKHGLHRPDLPGGFCLAWVNSVSIFNRSMDCTPGTLCCQRKPTCVATSDKGDPGWGYSAGYSPSSPSLDQVSYFLFPSLRS